MGSDKRSEKGKEAVRTSDQSTWSTDGRFQHGREIHGSACILPGTSGAADLSHLLRQGAVNVFPSRSDASSSQTPISQDTQGKKVFKPVILYHETFYSNEERKKIMGPTSHRAESLTSSDLDYFTQNSINLRNIADRFSSRISGELEILGKNTAGHIDNILCFIQLNDNSEVKASISNCIEKLKRNKKSADKESKNNLPDINTIRNNFRLLNIYLNKKLD